MDIEEIIFTTSSSNNKWYLDAWTVKGARISEFRTDNTGKGKHIISAFNGYLLESKIDSAKIDVWPMNKGTKDEHTRLILPGKISAFAATNEHDFISFSVQEKLYLYQSANGRFISFGNCHYQPVTVIKFNDDGTMVACGSDDGILSVWSLATHLLAGYTDDHSNTKPIYMFSDHMLPITDMAFSGVSFKPRLITISEDHTAKVYNISSGELLISIVTDYSLKSIAVTNIGSNIYLGVNTGKILDISMWDLPDVTEYHYSTETLFEGHSGSINCLELLSDGLKLVSGSSDCSIRIWDIVAHNCIQKIQTKGEITYLTISLVPIIVFTNRYKTLYNFKPLQKTLKKNIISMKCTRKCLRKIAPTLKVDKESSVENVDVLKRANKELFNYAVNKLINKYIP